MIQRIVVAVFLAAVAAGRADAIPLVNAEEDAGKPGAAAESPSTAKLRAGYEALRKRDLAAADAAFRESLRLDAGQHGALIALADVAMRKGQDTDAQKWLDKALTAAPRSAAVHVALGRYQFSRGQPLEAEKSYWKAISLEPQNFYPRIDLADLYMSALGKPKQAIDQYREAVRLKPAHGGAHYGLAMALHATGRVDDAIPLLQRAAVLAPRNPLPPYALAEIQLARGQLDDALQSLEHAAARGYVPARMKRGELFEAKGDSRRALAEYETAVKAAPKYGPARMKLALLHQREGRWADAEFAYLALTRLHPGDPVAYNNLAWMAAERRAKLDDALAWGLKAVSLAPGEGAFQDTLGWVHRARGDLPAASQALHKAAQLQPANAAIQYRLGVVLGERGEVQPAVAALRKALELDRQFAEADDARRRLQELSARGAAPQALAVQR